MKSILTCLNEATTREINEASDLLSLVSFDEDTFEDDLDQVDGWVDQIERQIKDKFFVDRGSDKKAAKLNVEIAKTICAYIRGMVDLWRDDAEPTGYEMSALENLFEGDAETEEMAENVIDNMGSAPFKKAGKNSREEQMGAVNLVAAMWNEICRTTLRKAWYD